MPLAQNCPICDKPADEKLRPFCSTRCADVDLGRWLGGRYRVETEEKPASVRPSDKEDEEE